MHATGFRYRAHGFTIASEFEIPELRPCDGSPDISIRYGETPSSLDGPVFRGQDYQVSGDRYLLSVPGIGRYLVTAARDVVVSPAPGADAIDVRMLVLSSVMGAIAHQRSRLPLHASAVEIGGQAVLFAGEPGTGKSTLIAAFHDRGHRVLGDDLIVIATDDMGRPVVEAGQRRVKLLPDALEHVGRSLGGREWTRAGAEKVSASIERHAARGPWPIARIFVLSPVDAGGISITPLSGRSKVAALVRETYRRGIPVAFGRRGEHFERCAEFGRALDIAQLERPRRFDCMADVVAAVLAAVDAGTHCAR